MQEPRPDQKLLLQELLLFQLLLFAYLDVFSKLLYTTKTKNNSAKSSLCFW
jgi:hypothetical protein